MRASSRNMSLRFFDDDFESRVIKRQVMREQQEEPAVIGGVACDRRAHHRRLTEIEP